MRPSFVAITILLSVSILSGRAQDTIKITDLGYEPGSRANAVKIVQQALTLAKSKHNPVIVFPKGRYDFWPQYSEEIPYFESNTDVIPFRTCPIRIYNQHHLTIQGSDAEFVFHDRVQPFTIDSSTDIAIKNVNVDWDIPLTAQAGIKSVTNDYIDISINTKESPYIIENNKIVFVGEGWSSTWWDAMEFGKDHLIVPQTADECLGQGFTDYKAEEIAPGTVRLNYNFKRKPAVGNFLVLRHSKRDHAGVFIINSKDISLKHFNLYHTAGLGILSQYSENLSFDSVQCAPNTAKNRYFSGHDDGMHFSNCKGNINIGNSRFLGLMDDPINVHGTSVQIIKKLDNNKLLCKFMHNQSIGFTWAQPGDTIGLIENEGMNTIGTAIVKSFKPIDPENFELTLTNSLPTALEPGDALENLTWTPNVWIHDSFFGSNRARGILLSTPGKVLVEKNTFESSGSAILIPGDANGWFESGAVKDVTIRNNTFNDPCLTSIYQFCEAIISIDPEIPKLDRKKPFHRNIRIENNTFHPFDYPVLYAKSTQTLSFNNNTIIHSNRYQPYHPRKSMITLEYCSNIEIKGNNIPADILGKNIQLKETPPSELKLDKKQNLNIEKPGSR